MSKTLAQATSFALALLVTAGVVLGASGLADQQFSRADAAAAADLDVASIQTVLVVGHHVKA